MQFLVEDILPLKLQPLDQEALHRLMLAPCFQARLRQNLRHTPKGDANVEVDGAIVDRLNYLDAKLNLLIQRQVDADLSVYDLKERHLFMAMHYLKVVEHQLPVGGIHRGDKVRLLFMLPLFPPVLMDLVAEIVAIDSSTVTLSLLFRDSAEDDLYGAYVFQRQREMVRRKKFLENND
ncbi:MAG: hypothetical protein HQM07_06515 [Zetaproteobacteria bacterium]|nr:hypothetical protein [Zetaproteobacteria bacterium]